MFFACIDIVSQKKTNNPDMMFCN